MLSPALIFGWPPFPPLGIQGAAVAIIIYYGLGTLVLLGYILCGRSLVRLWYADLRLRPALFWEILRVGAPGSLNTVLTNLNVVLLTGLVGPFGAFALAGYGMGARLEYLQIPLVFGFGSALVTMVGTNIGAGNRVRAERVAWVGAGLVSSHAACRSAGVLGVDKEPPRHARPLPDPLPAGIDFPQTSCYTKR
jgi:MATE family, multidrug efflux pump